MTSRILSAGAVALGLLLCPAMAADDDALSRMALCRDSWPDWSKSDPAKLKAFGDRFRTQFAPHDNDPFLLPKGAVSALGFRVTQAFPQSVGMGVGFSLTVDATFEDARKAVEKTLGKTLQHCETGDGMRNCGFEIAAQRTVTLMSGDKPGVKGTLIGCYYYYEK